MFSLDWLKKTKSWTVANKERLLLLVGLIAVGILAFEAGMLRGNLRQPEPLVLSIPAVADDGGRQDSVSEEKSVLGGVGRTAAVASVSESAKNCAFVGSRNSDKYHLPACAVAKRIKPENRVCFASKEDAEKRGYIAGCLK